MSTKTKKELWQDSKIQGQQITTQASDQMVDVRGHIETEASCQSETLVVTLALHTELRQILEEKRAMYARTAAIRNMQEKLEHRIDFLQKERAYWKSKCDTLQQSPRVVGADGYAARQVRYDRFVDNNGRVEAIHVTKFQLAIDGLLKSSQNQDPERLGFRPLTDAMELVLSAVHHILADSNDNSPPAEGLVTAILTDSEHLVETCKTIAIPLEPCIEANNRLDGLILLCEAADKLTSDVVRLLRLVKIKANSDSTNSSLNVDEFDELHIKIDGLGEPDECASGPFSTYRPLQDTVREMLRSTSPSPST